MPESDRDVLRLHVEIEAVVAAVASDPARLHPAEGRRKVADVLRIDPKHPRFEGLRDAVRAARVLSPDISCKTVIDVVRLADRILFIVEGDGRQHWPEYLFASNPHVGLRSTK